MNNLIYRDKAIEVISKLLVKVDNLEYTWMIAGDVLKEIDDMPSAELERKGKWIDDGSELGCCCSECGITLDDYFYGTLYEIRLGKMPNFCPNCGAKME